MSFSSKQYGWCDLSATVGGRILSGLTAIEYKESVEKDYLYGRGCKPHGIISGNRSFEGKISIWQSELEAMTRDAQDKDVLKLEFPITVAYVPHDGGQIVTDILQGCQFTEIPKGMNQGDKNKIIEMPIMFIGVKRQQ